MNDFRERRPISWLLLKILVWLAAYIALAVIYGALSIDPVWFVMAALLWHQIVEDDWPKAKKKTDAFSIPVGGETLDRMAYLYGVKRTKGESDEDLRQRVLKVIRGAV